MKKIVLGVVMLFAFIFIQRPASAQLPSCGGTSVSTTNPSSSTSYVFPFSSTVTYHGTMSIQAASNGTLNVSVGVPAEVTGASRSFWPWGGWGHVNGNAVQIILPAQAGVSSKAWYLEGTVSFSGVYGAGGTINFNLGEYTKDSHNTLHLASGFGSGYFTSSGPSGSTPATINGSPAPCASLGNNPVLHSPFNYNWEISNNWYTGTVTVLNDSNNYLELQFSDPHDGFGGWNGYAYCVRDVNMYIWCTIQTGPNPPIGGDPVWSVKLFASPYWYYPYGVGWQDTGTGQYIDFWGF